MPSLRLVCVIFLSSFFSVTASATAPALPPSPVELTRAKVTTIVHGVAATGALFANQSVEIKSEIAGKVIAINLPEGKQIERDTVLIELDDNIAKAELEQAIAKYDHSLLRYNRIQMLIDKGNGSQSEQDEALSNLRIDEANVALGKAQLEKTKIKAPFSGTLGLRKVNIGDYIHPGQALVHLDDVQVLLIDFSIPEKYISDLKTNQSVEITLPALPKARFTGKIIAISPQINHTTHSLQARAILANPEHLLRPGLFAKVKVIFNQNPYALVLPEQAVFSMQGKQYVYLVKNEHAALQEVKTGTRENNQVEIVKGINPSDDIVKSGHMKLYNGAKVFEVKV